MWCSKCQQDVPAVALQVSGPLVCPRCQLQLAEGNRTPPADSGISLDAFDRVSTDDLAVPKDPFAEEQSRRRLRQLSRQLRSSPQAVLSGEDSPVSFPSPQQPPLQLQATPHHVKQRSTSWGISLLIASGILGFCLGAGLLVWSSAFELVQVWQWGITTTIAAEGMLILGLTAMAWRLWRNSRYLNRQLTGVDRQLNQLQSQTGALAGSRLSTSQHYYQHFNQAASPHYLVANLRGQVDQLASRIAAEN